MYACMYKYGSLFFTHLVPDLVSAPGPPTRSAHLVPETQLHTRSAHVGPETGSCTRNGELTYPTTLC